MVSCFFYFHFSIECDYPIFLSPTTDQLLKYFDCKDQIKKEPSDAGKFPYFSRLK